MPVVVGAEEIAVVVVLEVVDRTPPQLLAVDEIDAAGAVVPVVLPAEVQGHVCSRAAIERLMR